MRLKHILIIVAAIFFVVLVAAFIYINYLLNASLPQRDGSIDITQLNDTVEITFDSMGIAQIWAENENDAWFALGWLHASDRLFQMDLTRRVAAGRLSELLGDVTLDVDRVQRTLGHTRMAKSELINLEYTLKEFLQAYTNGVNSWAEKISALPFEYQLLNMDFELWQIHDCLAIVSFQTWYSDALQNRDEFFNKLSDVLGAERARQLIIPYPDWAPLTVPQGGSLLQASNAWVVGPERSYSGKPILASDPHLDATRLPQFWYAVGIHSRDTDLNVFGITTPGLPFIVYGHNNHAAWAFTAAGVDVTDQYVEKLNPDNDEEYLAPDGWQTFKVFTERIKVKGRGKSDTLKVKLSRHGPVMAENDSLGVAYALKWAGFDRSLSQAIQTGFELYSVKSFQTFRNLVTQFSALDANWIYADTAGNIGYQLGTPIPIRKTAQTVFRLPGWDKQYDWLDYWPLECTPHSFNPKQGWLASCNNKPDEQNIPFPVLGNFAEDRILRITNLLRSKDVFSVDDMKIFQLDQISDYLIRWKAEAGRILRLIGQNDLAQQIEDWNGQATQNSKEVAIMDTWLAYVKRLTFSDEFAEIIKDMRNRLLFRDSHLEYIYFGKDSTWFDDITTKMIVETRDEITVKAMELAILETGDKTWGDLQTLTISHPMGNVPLVSGLLDLKRGPFARSGTTGTLNTSLSVKNQQGGFNVVVAPSWRMIIDLSDFDNMSITMPAGQSGNPRSEHFFDFFEMWQRGEYWQIPFSKNKVYEKARSVLLLQPR
jgi:penicillin amidase